MAPVHNSKWIIYRMMLVSYLVMLLMPILTGTLVYQKALKSFENQTQKTDGLILDHAVQIFDEKLERLQKMGYDIASKQGIKTFQHLYTTDPNQQLEMMYLLKDISYLCGLNKDLVTGYAIYFNRQDIILSNNSKYTVPEYWQMDYFEKSGGQSLKEFRENVLNSGWKKGFYRLSVGEQPLVCYVQSFPINSSSPLGQVILFLDAKNGLFSTENLIGMDVKKLCVLDENQNFIFSTDSDAGEAASQYVNGEKFVVSTDGTDSWMVSLQDSTVNRWRYLILSPTKLYMAELDYLKKIIWFVAGLNLVLGAVFAFLFTRQGYRPILRIYQAVSEGRNYVSDLPGNEYETIIRRIEDNKVQKKELGDMLKIQQSFAQSRLLMTLLNEKLTIPPEKLCYQSPGLGLDCSFFAVASFPWDSANGTAEYLRQIEVASVTPQVIVHAVDMMQGQCALLFCMDLQLEQIRPLLEETLGRLLGSTNDISAFGIGGIGTSLDKIPDIYRQSALALQYCLPLEDGRKSVIFYDDLSNRDYIRYFYPMEAERDIISKVKAGNVEAAVQQMAKIIDDNFRNQQMSREMSQCLIFDIVSTVNKIIWDLCKTEEDKQKIRPVSQKLLYIESPEQLKLEIGAIFSELGSMVQSSKKSHNSDLIINILHYIDEYYSNENLSLGNVADVMNITPSYLSRFFKEQTGCNFVDYLSMYRLERAKKLLNESGLSIKEVATRVGYGDPKNLTRIFKKYEGITPVGYRNAL